MYRKEKLRLDEDADAWHNWAMPKRSSKKSPKNKDTQQLARSVLDAIAPDAEPAKEKPPEKNPAAVALGRLGGLKGGAARSKSLTPEKRQEIAKKAAESRWSKARSADDSKLQPPNG